MQQTAEFLFAIGSILLLGLATVIVTFALVAASVPLEIAILLGCIAAATAPAATFDVALESGSTSRFSRLLLAIVLVIPGRLMSVRYSFQIFPGTDIYKWPGGDRYTLNIKPRLYCSANNVTDVQFRGLIGRVLVRFKQGVHKLGENRCPHRYPPGMLQRRFCGLDDKLFNPVVSIQFQHIDFLWPVSRKNSKYQICSG